MYGVARRLAVMAAMIVVVMALVWAGVHNLRARRAAMEKALGTKITLTKSDATVGATEDEPVTQLRGKVAPAFTLVDTAGKKVTLAEFKGHPVVVNFWATWCGPCKLEMPWFEEMYGKYKPDGLVILGLSQDDSTMSKVQIAAAAKKVGVSYPILMPDNQTAKTYGLSDYLPETFYVDKNGKIVDHTLGAHPKEQLEADIKETIAAGGQ
jgi:thiol-disulfide isomerase/thioredoxin